MTTKTRKLASLLDNSGDVKANSLDNVAGGLTVYATLDDLPTTGLTSGDQAYITATNRIYVSNGSGWYNVALINANPLLTIDPTGAIALAVDGSTPTVITLTGTDSDNADINLTYSVESDGSFANIATLSQDSSVFTITPLSADSATPGSSTLTFKVSDGISFGTGTTEFSLTFGPNWSTITESKVYASAAGAGDQFGFSVGINSDGTYAIVGAIYEDFGATNTGAAYIFTRSGSSWTQQAFLTASDAANSDNFGYAVDINGDGDIAIIGSKGDDDGGSASGSAYIFTRSGSTWTQQQKLVASDDTADDRFGNSVAISKDGMYAVIAAHNKDNGGTSQAGAVYIFSRSGSFWSQQAKLLASDAQANDQFGSSVGISGDGTYVIIGTEYEDTGATQGGAAYIFKRTLSNWQQQQKILASDPQESDFFGYSVDINFDGTTAIVGAFYEDGGAGDPNNGAGAAYIFTRSVNTWTQQQQLHSTTPGNIGSFGHSVSINDDGNLAAIGARYEYAANNTDFGAGRVHVFEKSGSTWSSTKVIIASDAQANDYLGEGTAGAKGVGISNDGNYIIAGAKQEDGGSGDPLTGQGAAYIWEAS
jgi:hypothetical protein